MSCTKIIVKEFISEVVCPVRNFDYIIPLIGTSELTAKSCPKLALICRIFISALMVILWMDNVF